MRFAYSFTPLRAMGDMTNKLLNMFHAKVRETDSKYDKVVII